MSTPASSPKAEEDGQHQAKTIEVKKMSYKLVHDALHAPECKGSTKLVLIALADFANEKTGLCYPAHATIAHTIGCSRRAVVSAITDLEKLGYIRRGPKHGLSLSYSFAIPSTCEKSSHNRKGALCEKSAHNGDGATCEKSSHNHPSEPVKNLHRGCEESSQGDVKNFHTNREDRIENNNRESTKQASNIESKTNTENQPKPTIPSTQGVLPAARDDKLFTLKQVALDARTKLIADGMDKEEAEKRLLAVCEDFKSKALALKAKNYEGISNPKKYLVAKLVGMAKDFKPSTPAPAQEPTSLKEIFNLLKTEWAATYPEVAEYIARLELDHVNDKLVSKLRGKESASWKSVPGSRIGYVRSTLDGTIYERVQDWRQEEIRDLENHLKTVRWSLATYRSEPSAYYDPHKTVEERIKELEASEADTKAALEKLRAKANR